MASKAPTVSVIIPVYRGEEHIARTLSSVLDQTFADFEVLCVEDNSPDASGSIIDGFCAVEPRVRHLRTPANLGIVPKIMNWVRPEVRGRYFVYSSQDDFFSPDWLEQLVAAVQIEEVDAAVPVVVKVADGAADATPQADSRVRRELISGAQAFLRSLDWSVAGNGLWKTEFLRNFGYFDFGLYADEYTARYYFLECRQVALCSSVFYYYQGNPSAITRKVSPGRLDYPYNEYRVWQLVDEHFPESDHSAQFARRAVRQLFECLALIAVHSELRPDRWRLDPAIEGMRLPRFQRALRRAFLPRERLHKAAAFGLLNSALLRRAAPSLVSRWRALRAPAER